MGPGVVACPGIPLDAAEHLLDEIVPADITGNDASKYRPRHIALASHHAKKRVAYIAAWRLVTDLGGCNNKSVVHKLEDLVIRVG